MYLMGLLCPSPQQCPSREDSSPLAASEERHHHNLGHSSSVDGCYGLAHRVLSHHQQHRAAHLCPLSSISQMILNQQMPGIRNQWSWTSNRIKTRSLRNSNYGSHPVEQRSSLESMRVIRNTYIFSDRTCTGISYKHYIFTIHLGKCSTCPNIVFWYAIKHFFNVSSYIGSIIGILVWALLAQIEQKFNYIFDFPPL